jgi:hypothetical protein
MIGAMAKKRQNKKKRKKSTVRHTRAIQRDRGKRPIIAPPDEKIQQRLEDLLLPAIEAQKEFYKKLGLRSRLLPLSVVVAIVVSIIWRQLGSGGSEVSRLLRSEGLLWVSTLLVSQQAISERLRTFPPMLFLRILRHILPELHGRWRARQRPLPPVLGWAQERYTAVLAADGSTLDALVRKVGLLRDCEKHPLAGKMMAVLDLCSWLPRVIWFEEDARASDQRFWSGILKAVPAGALLILDLGFTNFKMYAQMTTVTFITRAKSNLSFEVKKVYLRTSQVQDLLVWIGAGKNRQLVRLVKVHYQGKWFRYLTNELDPAVLPALYVAALYRQRWRIEIVFTQMTKTGLRASFAGWDDITDFHLAVVNDDAINEEFHQLSALGKNGLFQALLNTLAEGFNRSSYSRYFNSFPDLGFQLAQLRLESLVLPCYLLALALQFGQGDDFGQVSFQEAFVLPGQLSQGLLQGLVSRLQLLGQPLAALGALQGLSDQLRVGHQMAQVLPHQLIERCGGCVARRTSLALGGAQGICLAPTDVVAVARMATPSQATQLALAATDQTSQQVIVLRVVASRQLLIEGQSRLGLVKLLLTDDGRHGNGYPFLPGPGPMTLPRSDGQQGRLALSRRDGPGAISIGRAGVSGVLQDAPDGGHVPTLTPAGRRNPIV